MHRRSRRNHFFLSLLLLALVAGASTPRPARAIAGLDEIGGDDVVIEFETVEHFSLDIAANGDEYLAVSTGATFPSRLLVYRSTDGGNTWSEWAALEENPDRFRRLDLLIVDTSTPRLFLAVEYEDWAAQQNIRVYTTDLGASPSWSFATPMLTPGLDYSEPELTTDFFDEGPNYRVYLAAEGDDGASDIWFARTVAGAATWQTAFEIASSNTATEQFRFPSISYGFDWIHLTAKVDIDAPGKDDFIVHSRVFATSAGSSFNWPIPTALSSSADGTDDAIPSIRASQTNREVALVYYRSSADFTGFSSADLGISWTALPSLGTNVFGPTLEHLTATNNWAIGAYEANPDVAAVTFADSPSSWPPTQGFSDIDYSTTFISSTDIAHDPSRHDQVAMVYLQPKLGNPGQTTDRIIFDAEWRSAPGFPNLEPGFPVTYPSAQFPEAPALANMDDDPDLEMVFAVNLEIYVVDPDGTTLPGWPQPGLTYGPIPVGDMNGDGHNELAVYDSATRDIVLYNRDGTIAEGWPVDEPQFGSIYLAMGPLGGPYANYLISNRGKYEYIYNYAGVLQAPVTQWTGDTLGPSAIGDVDDDGDVETVTARDDGYVHVKRLDSIEMTRQFPGVDFWKQPTLVDLDFDGDLEIILQALNNQLYVIHHDGTDYPGAWPVFMNTSSSGVAVANLVGDARLEIVAGSFGMRVYQDDGSPVPGFPVPGLSTVNFSPVIQRVEGPQPGITVATTSGLFSVRNDGTIPDGWPEFPGEIIFDSPATADIDNDGSVELVQLHNGQLFVYDLNVAPHPDPDAVWPMEGYDSRRTGCFRCDFDEVTALDPSPSSFSFRLPSPNPASSSVAFRYALTSPGEVGLTVYDLRGRAVRDYGHTKRDAGSHVIEWDGRDRHGKRLATGSYFARLNVRAGGGERSETRRVTLVR